VHDEGDPYLRIRGSLESTYGFVVNTYWTFPSCLRTRGAGQTLTTEHRKIHSLAVATPPNACQASSYLHAEYARFHIHVFVELLQYLLDVPALFGDHEGLGKR
jgi:hypothetical protein